MSFSGFISTALQAAQNGDLRGAQAFIAQALKADPTDVVAWLCLAAVHPDAEKKRYALERVLALDPQHILARQALDAFNEDRPEAAEHIVMNYLEEFTGAEPISDMSENGAIEAPFPVEDATNEAVEADAPVDTAAESAHALVNNEAAEVEAKVEAPSSEETADAPAKIRVNQTPTRPTAPRHKNTCAQTLVLAILALLALGSVAALGYLLWREGLLPFGNPPEVGDGAIPTQVGMLRTPIPTWTATASPVPSATAIQLPPTATPIPATPAPSITPLQPGRMIVIGRSVDMRPIEVVRFGSGPNARLIVAGMHPSKGQPGMALAERLIEHLQQNPQIIPEGASLYILRSLNPDGEALASAPESRLNAQGVDLDRNFEANWKETWATGACPSPAGTAGEAPGSEPETKALVDFIVARGIQGLLVYESIPEGIALGGKSQLEAVTDLTRSLAEILQLSYPPPAPRCPRSGALIDWAAANGVPAAITIHVGPEEPDLQAHLKALEMLLSWEAPPPPTAAATASSTATEENETPTGTSATASSTPVVTASPGATP